MLGQSSLSRAPGPVLIFWILFPLLPKSSQINPLRAFTQQFRYPLLFCVLFSTLSLKLGQNTMLTEYFPSFSYPNLYFYLVSNIIAAMNTCISNVFRSLGIKQRCRWFSKLKLFWFGCFVTMSPLFVTLLQYHLSNSLDSLPGPVEACQHPLIKSDTNPELSASSCQVLDV